MFDHPGPVAQPEGNPGPFAGTGTGTETLVSLRVLDLPELFGNIAQHLDLDNLCTLRLVNRLFLAICGPYFSIRLDTDNTERYSDVGTLFVLLQDIIDNQIRTKESTTRWRRSPFDQIRALRVASGLDLYHYLSKIAPGGDMAIFLDHYRRWTNNENTIHFQTGTLTGASGQKPLCGHPLWTGLGKIELPWTFWDLIPSNGSALLCHLESLEVVKDKRDQSQSEECLNPFLVRLSQSSAANTLRSLSLGPRPKPIPLTVASQSSQISAAENTLSSLTLGTPDIKEWRINLRILCDCICSLRALESLTINGIDSFDLNDFYVAASTITTTVKNSEGTEEQNQQRRQQQPLAAKGVKSLIFNSAASTKVKVPILALFPNLESLTLDRPDGLYDHQMDQYLSTMENQGLTTATGLDIRELELEPLQGSKSRRFVIVFPRLKLLHVPFRSIDQWDNSLLLQTWLRTTHMLAYLDVIIRPSIFMFQLLDMFSKEAITLQSIKIRSAVMDNATHISKLLLSPQFQTITRLQIQTAIIPGIGIAPN